MTKFVLECYVKPIMRRILSLIVIGMCLSVLFSEVGLMAGNDSAVAVLSRGEEQRMHAYFCIARMTRGGLRMAALRVES